MLTNDMNNTKLGEIQNVRQMIESRSSLHIKPESKDLKHLALDTGEIPNEPPSLGSSRQSLQLNMDINVEKI